MEKNVKKELDTIKQMVLRWQKSYLGWARDDGGNDYLIEEFSEEISMYVSPLVRRLCENDFLTSFEHHEFMDSCYNQLNELHDLIKIKEAETKTKPKGIWA
ncbi:MAG: hypothetical protein JRF62_02570 [Deltaproteobacteria bacterium]|nr:hypothetical protein [Deltaproteobacteria bacterium]MBW2246083.1 hypothetical protein [Deltaproteobacteria bacterium]MBW2597574.1 hypothetical protein [Deltaproteobacteria bacterium]MBW2639032.1 hypothetical protein [Deltaproteobacteria bacterium]MBW2679565.1 hypothetical protein [Deltaproteobacteria bacterium]